MGFLKFKVDLHAVLDCSSPQTWEIDPIKLELSDWMYNYPILDTLIQENLDPIIR